jgi:hypothetical protein
MLDRRRVFDMLTNPTESDLEGLAKQLAFTRQIVKQRFGLALPSGVSALNAIQRLLDEKVFSADQTWELQALGVVLGTVLVDEVTGLDWAIVDDEYGRDPTLRYRDTSIQINVLTMISKRVEDGAPVDVWEIFRGVVSALADLKTQAQ